ncbi:hypothetical protein DM02DRAFT_625812 [Periconia macrospinosa]|uniref:C2H2-type domain-containing protein n=1 Tax=Periconia macrospinosa TaxID=97972 RepID=A0A2V1DYH9_9PLEO|nr:hypothetical protein DM02DRAFT_625812 [Periconia macrospinosa]
MDESSYSSFFMNPGSQDILPTASVQTSLQPYHQPLATGADNSASEFPDEDWTVFINQAWVADPLNQDWPSHQMMSNTETTRYTAPTPTTVGLCNDDSSDWKDPSGTTFNVDSLPSRLPTWNLECHDPLPGPGKLQVDGFFDELSNLVTISNEDQQTGANNPSACTFPSIPNRDPRNTSLDNQLTIGNDAHKSFSRIQDLHRHHRGIHMQERKFVCRYAGCLRASRGFPRKDKLSEHERKVHGRKR